MELNPGLGFNGDCEAAFRFYEKILGGKICALVRYKDTPMAGQVPPDWQERIIHARLTAGERTLMGGDPPPGAYEQPKGMSVMLSPPTVGEAERLFAALAEGGTVRMPIQETFWALRFGMLIDRFGIPWMVNCERPRG
jgi:PhnB protein